MRKLVFITALASLILAGCIPPGQLKKHSAPGQVQKATGYNPASGKVKAKH